MEGGGGSSANSAPQERLAMVCTNLSYIVRLHRIAECCIDAMAELARVSSPDDLANKLRDLQALVMKKCVLEGRRTVRANARAH